MTFSSCRRHTSYVFFVECTILQNVFQKSVVYRPEKIDLWYWLFAGGSLSKLPFSEWADGYRLLEYGTALYPP